MQHRHVTVALFLTLVAFVAAQWGRVCDWYMSLPPLRQYLWFLFAFALALGIIGRQFGVDAAAHTLMAVWAAVVIWIFSIIFKGIRSI